MMHKNRKSPRLKNWNYGSNSLYFITICTKNREHFFGEIHNGKMQFSPAGAIAHVLWFEIKNHTKNVDLGEFVVMPNHVHGILILDDNHDCRDIGGNMVAGGNDVGGLNVDCKDVDCSDVGGLSVDCKDVACNVPTVSESKPEIPHQKNDEMAAISPKSNTVSSIIRSYKSAVTKYCNRLELPIAWQPRFHDHIIRNDESFQRISAYIKNNPANWNDDTFH